MIQLSLFPRRGYGLLGFDGLVEDWTSGEPFFTPSKTNSDMRHALKALNWGSPRIVRLERHEDSDDDGRAAFVVSELQV